MDKQNTLYIFSDYVCPWCYLGHTRLKKVLKEFKINTETIHFPLHPDTPYEGKKLTELLDNVELRTKLGKRGKEIAESQYSWDNKIIEYLEAAK